MANIYFLELKFSKECTDSIKNITKKDFEKYEKKLKEEIEQIIIKGAISISESGTEIKNYDKIKQLDNLLKNLQEIVSGLDIDDACK